MKKNDIYLAVFLLFLSVLLYLFYTSFSKPGDTVVIYANNEIFQEFPLNKDEIINVNNSNIVCIKNGKVFMEKADCPDQICVHQPPLSTSERDIVCLPNKVTVKVVKKSVNSLDAVSR